MVEDALAGREGGEGGKLSDDGREASFLFLSNAGLVEKALGGEGGWEEGTEGRREEAKLSSISRFMQRAPSSFLIRKNVLLPPVISTSPSLSPPLPPPQYSRRTVLRPPVVALPVLLGGVMSVPQHGQKLRIGHWNGGREGRMRMLAV
jgi:hypothetical protein